MLYSTFRLLRQQEIKEKQIVNNINQQNSCDYILNCIIKTSESFFQNDMKIDIEEVTASNSDIHKTLTHMAAIQLEGSFNFLVILTMDKKLHDTLYDIFFTVTLNKEEKKQMLDALPDEVINTVVGLAMQNFDTQFDDLVLSEPIFIDHEMIEDYKINNNYCSKKIETAFGKFNCIVIDLKGKSK
jgi:hypothetical protein